MADNRTIIKNLGKSVAYSTLNVLSPLVPNTAEFVRSARSGIDVTRDFMQRNMAKIQQASSRVDKSAVTRKARTILNDAINDIKKGNLSLGDLMDDDSYFDSYNFDDDYEPSEVSEDSDNSEQNSQRSVIVNNKATVEGLQTVASVLGNTTIKSAQYQAKIVSDSIITGVATITDQMQRLDNHLVLINNNIAQLVKFQNESQALTNQAMLRYFDQHIEYLRQQEKRQTELDRRTRQRNHNPAEGFMSNSYFDFDAYRKIVKDNYETSIYGQLGAMLGIFNPDTIGMMMSGGDKFQPQKFALEGIIKALIPKMAKRSLQNADKYVNNYMKNILTTLGSKRYESGILGQIGSIFGIDSRQQRSINFGDYNRNAMNWNGDAQKVLTQIIPKQLSEIKAAILKKDPEYYDSKTGRFMTRSSVINRARKNYQQSTNAPIANLFNNPFTMNPENLMDNKIWSGLTSRERKALESLTNKASNDAAGFTNEISNKMTAILASATERLSGDIGSTFTDAARMVNKLNTAVNEIRDNIARQIRQFSDEGSAISQILMDQASDTGWLSQENILNAIDGGTIDLIGAQSGAYTFNGVPIDKLSPEEKKKYYAQFETVQDTQEKIGKTKIGKLLYRFIQGGNRGKRTANVINAGSNKLFKTVTGYKDGMYNVEDLIDEENGTYRSGRTNTQAPPGGEYKEGPGAASSSATRRAHETGQIILGRSPTSSGSIILNGWSRPESSNGLVDQNGNPLSSSGNAAWNKAISADNPDARTAEAAESMNQNVEDALGPKGFIREHYEKLKEKFKNTSVGKWFTGKVSDAKNFVIELFTKDGMDENGKKIPSVLTNIRIGASKISGAISESILGDEDPDKAKEKIKNGSGGILKKLNAAVRKHAPKILTGGVIGTGLGALAMSGTGLLGSLFLPGGPIGGAIAGMGISIMSNSEGFKKFLFGDKDADGKHTSGLINKDLMDKFKKVLPALGIGAGAGVLGKFLLGGTTVGKAVGFLPGLLTGNGILGAAIFGSAAAMVLNNNKFKDIMFGKEENGKRIGSVLSGMYNKFTEKIKNFTSKGTGKDIAKRGLLGAGAGVLASATIGQMGVFGSALTFGGPIGAAIAGSAIGIASLSDKFHDFLFGKKDKEGKPEKSGMIDRFKDFLNINFIEPVGMYFKHTASEFAWWAKDKIEVPFRLAFGPVVDAFTKAKDTVVDVAKEAVNTTAKGVQAVLIKIFNPIGHFFMKHVLSPIGKVAGGVLKMGLYGAGSLASAPLNMLSFLMSGKRRKEMKGFDMFMTGNEDKYLENASFFERLGYNASKVPVFGRFLSSRIKDRALEDYVDSQEYMYKRDKDGNKIPKMIDGAIQKDDAGNILYEMDESQKNAFGWMRTKLDRKGYRKSRKDQKRTNKEETELIKLRQKWVASDKTNRTLTRRVNADELKRRNDALKKYGINISNSDELVEFMYDYDNWYTKKNGGEFNGPSAGPTDPVTQAVTETGEKHTSLLTQILDAVKAIFDVQTGKHADSNTITNSGNSMSEAIDSNEASEIADANMKEQANATAEAINRVTNARDKAIAKRNEKERITGNTSGDATEHTVDDTAEKIANGTASAKQKENFLSKLLGGLGDSFGSILKVAGIALSALFIGNGDFRKWVTNLVKDTASKIPGLIKDKAVDLLGIDGGVNNSRAVEYDKDGNVTKSVLNEDMIGNIALSAKTSFKAGSVGPTFLKSVKGLAKATNYTASRLIPPLGIAEDVGKGAINIVKKAGGAVRTATTNAVNSAAKGESLNVVQKALKLFSDAFTSVAESKLGKTFSTVKGIASKFATFIDDIYTKLANKALGKFTTKLTAAISYATGKNVSNVTPVVVLNAIIAGGAAILGALDAERLFNVNKDDVDWKMRAISAVWSAVGSLFGIAALVSVLNEITTEFLGFDFVQKVAVWLYKFITFDKKDEDRLDQAILDFQQEVNNYNKANGTNLSVSAYEDLKNKSTLGNIGWQIWNNNIFARTIRASKGEKAIKTREDFSQYEVGNYNPSNYTGRGATGYGASQYDPRWANRPIGVLPNGNISTMATGGCGPTAIVNAYNALQGYGIDPGTVGAFAAKNGYITDGGANSALFDQGVNAFGMTSNKVSGGSGILNSLRNGHPVIMSGRGSGSYSPYTDVGHIVTATGIDSRGNVIVQDPRSNAPYSRSIGDLTSGMTNAWSMSNIGYGPIEEGITNNSNVTNAQQALVNKMKSIAGTINYSLGDVQDPDKGTASCASTVGWAYRKVLGLKNMSTSTQYQSNDSRFVDIVRLGRPGSQPGKTFDTSILQPGDIVYMYNKWNGGASNHTEMYIGNGKDLSHGGPGKGPSERNLNASRQKRVFAVRRYKGFTDGSQPTILDDGTSSGITNENGTGSSNSSNSLINALQSNPLISGISNAISSIGKIANNVLYKISGGLFGSSDVDTENTSGADNVESSGSTVSFSDQSKEIYNYLIKQGFTKEAASGIMGCWQNESGNRSNIVEGYYLKGYPGFNQVMSSNAAMNNYVKNILFPAYKKSGISIRQSGYLGTDKNYYPGIGLAQWTGPRAQKLVNWAKANNYDVTKLNTQLKYFEDEIKQRGTKSVLNAATTPEDGARLALDNYEMYSGFSNTSTGASQLSKRKASARQIYNKFATGSPNANQSGATGYGYGGFNIFNNASRGTRSPFTGYGTGGIDIRTDNTGVESRLDRLIVLLESINRKSTSGGNTTNINYGDTTVKETKINPTVNNNTFEKKSAMSSDGKNTLRQRHIEIASGKHL